MTERILVVEDDVEMRRFLADELAAAGFTVEDAADGAEAIARLQAGTFDAVLTDLVMPDVPGDALLARAREWNPLLPVVIMTAFGSIESAVDAMRRGAYHYLTKPFTIDDLLATLRAALDESRLRRGAGAIGPDPGHGPALIGECPAMARVLTRLERAAAVDSPVLIRGESGTGKELLARALHARSARAGRAFVAVNSSAIPETLLESQLFGHRRGAFTDAREDRRGLFQQADGGTLFLDEIGDMPLGLQARILRALQEREVQPLGAATPERVDVRVVAATHRDLEAMCAAGTFRTDLYYRLNVIALDVPPLRERPGDLVPLVAHFLEKHAARLGRQEATVGREAMDVLRGYAWPGNVRELENVIERALVLGDGPRITPADLPERMTSRQGPGPREEVRSLSEVEREEIVRALRAVRGNKAAAARLLGLDRKTLYRKLELYEIREV